MATDHVRPHHHHHHNPPPPPPPPIRIDPPPAPIPAIDPPDHCHHFHHHHHQMEQQQREQRTLGLPFSQATKKDPPPLPPRPMARTAPVAGGELEPIDLMDLEFEQRPNSTLSIELPPLPIPGETPTNEIPPEMEEASQNWRQYAASVLLHERKLTGSRISQEMDDWEMEEEEGEMAGEEEEEEPIANFRGRRTTVTYRFPTGSNPASEEQQQQRRRAVARKLSMGHQQRRSADDPRSPVAMSPQGEQRRFSFQERSLLNANYAILRKSVDRFEVVGAFHRCHSEAYRHFLQSLTCYDLAPQHGLIVMLDAELTIQKAIQTLCAHPAPRVAVISNTKDGHWAMFTVTDCLLALQKAHSQLNAQLGEQTLRHFLEHVQNGRRLISVDDQTSVWDLCRMFTLNRVHRVPVFAAETAELIAILCPRAICVELLKLLASKCSLSPDLNSIPLSARLIGTWGIHKIASVQRGNNCAQAVDIFLENQVSALPVLSQDGTLLGVLDKNNLLDCLFDRLGSHQTPERCFQLIEEMPVEELLPQARPRTVRADCSVADAMRVLTEDGLIESLFVVEPSSPSDENGAGGGGADRLCGVLSYTDILAFILSCEQQQQAISIG